MRTERDALGEVAVPAGAYYGAETVRAAANFKISGRKPRRSLIKALAQVKLAAARANVASGQISDEVGEVVERAARELIDSQLADQFLVDPYQPGAGTSTNMNVNEVIANRAGELLGEEKGTYRRVHPNDHVNKSQSSNDAFPTAVRIALLGEMPRLFESLDRLAGALRARAEAFSGIVKSGRTHLRDAVPITLGREFAAYAVMLERSRDRLRQTIDERLTRIPLGGTATGTGFGAPPGYAEQAIRQLSEITGLELVAARDPVEAVRNLGDLGEFAADLKSLSLALGQIANDLRLMSMGPRTGIAEIVLPPVQPGSSIMPGKVNPSIPEMVNMVCMRVAGASETVSLAVGAGQLDMNVMTPVIADELLEVIGLMTNAMSAFASLCVEGIEADVERCRKFAEDSLAMATALEPYVGYDRAAEVAVEAFTSGRSLREVAEEAGILPAKQLAEILDPSKYA